MIGGSGNGEQIAANKVKGVRAALAWSTDTAKLGREHNDANVISIGARMHSDEDAIGFVERSWPRPTRARSGTPAGSRCCEAYESTGELPPLPPRPDRLLRPDRFGFGRAARRSSGRGRETSRARIDRPIPTTAGVGATAPALRT